MIDVTALQTAIDADTAPGGLAELAAIGADNQIAARLAAETVPAVKNPTYLTEGELREPIIELLVGQGTPLLDALSQAKTAIDGLKATILATPGAEVYWAYADPQNPRSGLNVGGPLERAFLQAMTLTDPPVIAPAYAAAILARAETTAPKWPGISTDIVSAALNTEERRPGGKVVPQ